MRRLAWWPTIGLTVTLILNCALQTRADSIYFTSGADGTISRLDLANFQVTPLVSGAGEPHGIAIDAPDGKMFWADNNLGTIRSANLDGTGMQTLVSGLNSPTGIALDLQNGKVFWTDQSDIRSANLDGSNQQLLLTGLTAPAGIAIDAAGGKLYWGDNGTGIHSADLDGSNPQLLVSSTYAFAMGLDLSGGQMYWSWQGISRASLVGGSFTQLIPAEPSQLNDTGLALDLAGGLMYWADQEAIFSAQLDGTGRTTVYNGNNLYGIALGPTPVPEPTSLVLAGLGLAGLLGLVRRRRPVVLTSSMPPT